MMGDMATITPKLGEQVFVRASFQAEHAGVEDPDRVFTGIITQVFPGRTYVNTVCFNPQRGPETFRAQSVSLVGTTDQTGNLFAYREWEL